MYAARNKIVSLKICIAGSINEHNTRNNGIDDKENVTTSHTQPINQEILDYKGLWLRLLLVYGSNQHFVKPITVCQQHRKEKFSSGIEFMEDKTKFKTNEPINLSKSSLDDIMVPGNVVG